MLVYFAYICKDEKSTVLTLQLFLLIVFFMFLRPLAYSFKAQFIKPTIKSRFSTSKISPKPSSLFNQLRPFLKFAKPEIKLVGGSLVLLMISSAVTMSVPFSMGAIIDIVMEKLGDQETIQKLKDEPESQTTILKRLLLKTGSLNSLFGVLVGVFVIGAVANVGRQVLMAIATGRVNNRLRNSLFEKLISKDISFHDVNRSGELISRLSSDTIVVGSTLTQNVADGFRSLVLSATGISAMLYVNVDLTITTMCIVPLVAGVAVIYGKYVRKLAKITTDAAAELTNFAEEKLGNIRTVRAFSKETTEIRNYNQKSDIVYDLGIKEGIASALFYSSVIFNLK